MAYAVETNKMFATDVVRARELALKLYIICIICALQKRGPDSGGSSKSQTTTTTTSTMSPNVFVSYIRGGELVGYLTCYFRGHRKNKMHILVGTGRYTERRCFLYIILYYLIYYYDNYTYTWYSNGGRHAWYQLYITYSKCWHVVYSHIVFSTVDLAKRAGIMLHITYYYYYEYLRVYSIVKKTTEHCPHR